MVLIPENANRKLDSLGRITLPKGLRNRLCWEDGAEIELFTATIDGRTCVCLAKPVEASDKIEEAIELLRSSGYTIEEVIK